VVAVSVSVAVNVVVVVVAVNIVVAVNVVAVAVVDGAFEFYAVPVLTALVVGAWLAAVLLVLLMRSPSI
jgi:hypothetical protein